MSEKLRFHETPLGDWKTSDCEYMVCRHTLTRKYVAFFNKTQRRLPGEFPTVKAAMEACEQHAARSALEKAGRG